MVAGIETVTELARVVIIANGFVEVYAPIEIGGGSEPFVECGADDVAIFVVGAPAVNWEERAAVNLEAELAGMRDVKRADAVDEIVCRGHVAPWAELVDFDTDRVDNVVDAVLHDDSACACDVHFDREARGAFKAVGGVGDAAVFSQDACAADCTTDDGDVVKTFAGAAEREVIGPVLRGDGIAKADKRKVLFFGENVDGVEEVNPVCFAREVIGERCAFCKIAVAVLAARKRARDSCAGVHLCEISEVKADIECFACSYVEWNFVAQDFFAGRNRRCSVVSECDGCWNVSRRLRGYGLRGICCADCGLRGLCDIRFADGHRFGAGEVRKMEPQFIARKAGANRIAER